MNCASHNNVDYMLQVKIVSTYRRLPFEDNQFNRIVEAVKAPMDVTFHPRVWSAQNQHKKLQHPTEHGGASCKITEQRPLYRVGVGGVCGVAPGNIPQTDGSVIHHVSQICRCLVEESGKLRDHDSAGRRRVVRGKSRRI